MATGTFGYRRGIAPMLWVLVALCSIELIVEHLLLAHWWPRVAMVVSIATLSGIVWLVRAIRSFDRLPVLVEDERVVLRVGTFRSVAVPRAMIAGVRLGGWSEQEMKARPTLKLSLIAWPNVTIDLAEPLPGRRGVVAIAHRLDDPAGFAAALERVGAGDD